MDLPNSRTAVELARLEADFANSNIGNRHVTHRHVRRESWMHGETEEVCYSLYKSDSSVGEGTIPNATTSSNH